MVTHQRYLCPNDIASSNPYLSAPISTRRYSTPGLISIECVVYFWICLTILCHPLCSIPPHTAPLSLFHIFIKAVCPTRLFIIWLIPWRQLIHFSHGPTCLCLCWFIRSHNPLWFRFAHKSFSRSLSPLFSLSLPYWADVPQYGRTIG